MTTGATAAGILALFQKRLAGDDALLALAKRRFEQGDLGAEFYAGSFGELEGLLRFRPATAQPTVVHLPRGGDLLDPAERERVQGWAARCQGTALGLVLHDQPELAADPESYARALAALDAGLRAIPRSPWLFVEYAVGVEPEDFLRCASRMTALERISVCLDVGHMGMHVARATFAREHAGLDVCTLKPGDARLEEQQDAVQAAVRAALPVVLNVVSELRVLARPVHFHLHDGHPASTESPYGVCDHLPFGTGIPVPFRWQGRAELTPLFGRAGLEELVRTAGEAHGPAQCSFTLELHPPAGRRPLEDAAPLFAHWRDKTNAEQMNHWLGVLAEHAAWVRAALAGAKF